MAASLFTAIVASHPIDCPVASAGVSAYNNEPASGHAINVMAGEGLDLHAHRSRRLSQDIMDTARLVLTMTAGHKQAVLGAYPGAVGRVFTLCEYAGERGDVHDPFGGSEAVYRECAAQIKRLLHRCHDKLREEIAQWNQP